MKKIIIFCIIINVLIYSTFTYFVFFKENDIEIHEMVDVSNMHRNIVETKLDNYQLEFIYCESLNQKDTVLYTIPEANSLTQEGQLIQVFISTGYVTEYFDTVTNKYYEELIDYLNYLESINVNVIVEKQLSNDYPDGIIVYQSQTGKIQSNTTFKIIVNYNEPLILVEDFTNKTEQYVIDYFKETKIEVYFLYQKKDNTNLVFDQSIKPNSLIKNNISVIYIYISI